MQKQTCSRCICDTTIPSIIFDQDGVCNFCYEYDERDRNYPLSRVGAHRLESIINTIKKHGQRRTYDCVIGISGGTDSTYCLYLAKKWGLRPLAVHFDNGWDSKIAFENIKKATDALDIDLYTHVADWEEFKDLQLAFLKASVPDADIPTDVAIHAVLYRTCQSEDIRYIINGSNFRTEGNQPPSWGYGDGKYVMSVYQKFGKYQKLSKIPVDTLYDLFNFHIIQGLRVIKPLYFIDYQKEQAKSLLTNELGWQYYGGHHYENTYTRFIHGYYLPKKFGIDKRIIEYSALIRSNQMTREEALQKLVQPCYLPDQIEDDIRFVLNKLGMSRNDFEEIMNQPNKCFTDYITYYPIIIKLRFFLSMAQKLGLYPDKIYGRYSY